MAKRTRKELKEIFKTGAQPTGLDFHDFIDSISNLKEDGFEKPQGDHNPIRFSSHGTEQNLLDFFDQEGIHRWRINQYPEEEINNETEKESGLNFETSEGKSRLFINDEDGKVGIGTIKPNAKLHIVQEATDADCLRIDDSLGDETPLVVKGDGAVGINTPEPGDGDPNDVKLQVNGHLKLQEGVSVNKLSEDGTLAGNSNQTIPTESAVKEYVEHWLPPGVILMWSGSEAEIPDGWKLCNGQPIDPTIDPSDPNYKLAPDLRGRFIVAAGDGSGYNPNDSGDADTHQHIVEIPSRQFYTEYDGVHSHHFSHSGETSGTGGSCNKIKYPVSVDNDGNHRHSVNVLFDPFASETYSDENRPKWYALCYIIKI